MPFTNLTVSSRYDNLARDENDVYLLEYNEKNEDYDLKRLENSKKTDFMSRVHPSSTIKK